MARKKISEFKAKSLLMNFLNLDFKAASITSENFDSQIKKLDLTKRYVAKVDQGVKKRFKNHLIVVNEGKKEVSNFIKETIKKGFTQFIVEGFVKYEPEEEKYLSLERTREGILFYFSSQGGVDIEANKDRIQTYTLNPLIQDYISKLNEKLELPNEFLSNLVEFFEKYFISFLEINPLVIKDNKLYILDLAMEVDSTAEYFVKGEWSSDDFVKEKILTSKEIQNVNELDEKSSASLKLNLLNENGSIFMLLSGGGASLVLADECFQIGFAKEIANYGEYSGNPTTEETYLYTSNVLSLLLKSKAKKKVLIIAGGVANFTDVYVTFQGIIQALKEKSKELKKQKLKVFVRRGGPNEEKGLQVMREFLDSMGINGGVYGKELVLTDIIHIATNYLK